MFSHFSTNSFIQSCLPSIFGPPIYDLMDDSKVY